MVRQLFSHKLKRVMKNILSLAILIIALSSCSQCYECSQEITINGVTTTTDGKEVCSVDGSEIDELESKGEVCEPL